MPATTATITIPTITYSIGKLALLDVGVEVRVEVAAFTKKVFVSLEALYLIKLLVELVSSGIEAFIV